jgi:hypothetical protein
MTLDALISSLHTHGEKYPLEKENTERVIAWIEKYGELAFVRSNLA